MLLVTGITGHSGSYFLDELVKNQYDEKIICTVRERSNTKRIDSSPLMIEKKIGDLADLLFLKDIMSNIETVLHIGSIFYSENIVKAAVYANVKRIILVHTTGIYSKFKSASEEYQRIEKNVGAIVEGKNIEVVILRPTLIYGSIHDNNMIVFIKMIDKLKYVPIVDNGSGLLQPVFAKDLGKAYYQVITNTSISAGNYILSGDQPITMKALFQEIANTLNKKVVFISFSSRTSILLAKILKNFTFGKLNFIERVQRMTEDRSFSHEKASLDFGYKTTPLSEGLEFEITDYLERK